MKKQIILLTAGLAAFGLLFSTSVKAQGFDKGTNVINLGVGFGGEYTYFGAGYSATPAISVSYEQGIWPNIGPGTISLGGLFAYKGISYSNNFQDWDGNGIWQNYTEKDSWTYYIIGLRAAYHLKTKNDKFDPYAGLMIGYYHTSYSYTNTDPNYGHPGYYGYNTTAQSYSSYVTPSFFIGARYMFSNFGIFGELGYGYSNLTLGLSYKW
ncbi:MAG: hypothetical protein ABI199_08060 [Bacteroidia bacterium]